MSKKKSFFKISPNPSLAWGILKFTLRLHMDCIILYTHTNEYLRCHQIDFPERNNARERMN